ncbi:MAG: hypothetical protein KKI09_11565 [Spirochaetes bacterium]|nr:hypothetical protein [Spirochaetota bacterium]MBU0956056.1 hypothetical protein [Spirochaetota bacterium]
MNLTFYKLHSGGSAWILLENKNTAGPEPDYSKTARELCNPLTGAGACALVVLEYGKELTVRSWLPNGSRQSALGGPVLCAARWAFDNGQAVNDSLRLRTAEQYTEVLALDSRIFSVCLLNKTDSEKTVQSCILQRNPQLKDDENYTSTIKLQTAFGASIIHVWDGPIPRSARNMAVNENRLQLGLYSRDRAQLRCGNSDPFRAAAITVLAASSQAYCESQAGISHRKQDILVHPAQDNSIFVAAPVDYCFSGEYWQDDQTK